MAFALGAMVGPLVAAEVLETIGWGSLCLILSGMNAVGFIAWVSAHPPSIIAENEQPGGKLKRWLRPRVSRSKQKSTPFP